MNASIKIRNAFRELLREVLYNRISVEQILKKSDVSRKTFYCHYGSKSDLVAALLDEDLVEPVLNIRKSLPFDTLKSASILGLERAYQIIYDNRDVYLNLISNYGEAKFTRAMILATEPLNRSIYANYNLSEEEVSFAAFIQAAAQPAIIFYWIRENFATSPKKMARLHDN